MLTAEEKQNALVLIEVGCRSLSADKPLQESIKIQTVAAMLIEKVSQLNTCELKEPEP